MQKRKFLFYSLINLNEGQEKKVVNLNDADKEVHLGEQVPKLSFHDWEKHHFQATLPTSCLS